MDRLAFAGAIDGDHSSSLPTARVLIEAVQQRPSKRQGEVDALLRAKLGIELPYPLYGCLTCLFKARCLKGVLNYGVLLCTY